MRDAHLRQIRCDTRRVLKGEAGVKLKSIGGAGQTAPRGHRLQGASPNALDLFRLEDADVVQLIRWQHAVPDVRPGYHRRLADFRQRPPVVFAGDWLVQPCVEGAVRSGAAAAAVLLERPQ